MKKQSVKKRNVVLTMDVVQELQRIKADLMLKTYSEAIRYLLKKAEKGGKK